MDSWTTRVGNGALNAVLLVGGVATAALLYAFGTQLFVSAPTPERPSGSPEELVGPIIQVEVRNGAGVANLAERATQYLRDRGFDVVDVGNHSSFDQERSVVVDRAGNLKAARRVAEALGLPDDRVRQKIRRHYYLDASVIIGHDYRQLRPFRQ